jgi:hypothetical protein
MTPWQRVALQTQCVQEYEERLARGQWRDPVTGVIRPRRTARANWRRTLLRGLSPLLLVLALQGCAATRPVLVTPTTQAYPHFHPALALEPLLAFHAAVLRTEGLEDEQQRLIVRWIADGVMVLRGPHPEDWEATAREQWPAVRSAIGPYESLVNWAAVFDGLLQ